MRMHDRERRLWTAHVRELEAALEDLVKASPTALVKAPKV